MTEIDDLLSNGWVRRWSLIDGRPRCVEDAIAPTDAGALAALQQNKAVRDMIALVEAYEDAERIVAAGEPDNGEPRQIADPDAVKPEDAPDDWTPPLIDNPAWALAPREIMIGDDLAPEPRWLAYDAAAATVAGASASTIAHAAWRAGEPSSGDAGHSVADDAAEAEGAAWEAARAATLAELATRAAAPLEHDPRPIKESISRRQFAMSCAQLGLMTPTEAMGFVTTNTIPAILAAAIARLPAQMQFGAQLSVAGSMTFERTNPATVALMDLATLPPGYANAAALRDAIWRLGATFP